MTETLEAFQQRIRNAVEKGLVVYPHEVNSVQSNQNSENVAKKVREVIDSRTDSFTYYSLARGFTGCYNDAIPPTIQEREHITEYNISRIAWLLGISCEQAKERCQRICRESTVESSYLIPNIERYIRCYGEFPQDLNDLMTREGRELGDKLFGKEQGDISKDCHYYFDTSGLSTPDNPYPICSVNPKAKNCKDCSDYRKS